MHWITIGPIAFIIGYIPLLGSIVGMVGAVDAWGWEWWQAGGLFFGGLIVTVVFGGLSALTERFTK